MLLPSGSQRLLCTTNSIGWACWRVSAVVLTAACAGLGPAGSRKPLPSHPSFCTATETQRTALAGAVKGVFAAFLSVTTIISILIPSLCSYSPNRKLCHWLCALPVRPFFKFLGPGKETKFFSDKAETTIKNVPEQRGEVTVNSFHLNLHHFNAVIYGWLSFEAFMVLHCQKGQKFLGSGETLTLSDLAARVTCEVTLSSRSNSTINCSSKRKGALLSPASVTCRTIADWILVVRWFYFFFYFFPPLFSTPYFQ